MGCMALALARAEDGKGPKGDKNKKLRFKEDGTFKVQFDCTSRSVRRRIERAAVWRVSSRCRRRCHCRSTAAAAAASLIAGSAHCRPAAQRQASQLAACRCARLMRPALPLPALQIVFFTDQHTSESAEKDELTHKVQ